MAGDKLIRAKYGVMTPEFDSTKLISPKQLDLVIVPLLGFNSSNFRLGRGAGYYDYTFAFRKKGQDKPKIVGLGFRWQQIEFNHESWDLAMDQVITA